MLDLDERGRLWFWFAINRNAENVIKKMDRGSSLNSFFIKSRVHSIQKSSNELSVEMWMWDETFPSNRGMRAEIKSSQRHQSPRRFTACFSIYCTGEERWTGSSRPRARDVCWLGDFSLLYDLIFPNEQKRCYFCFFVLINSELETDIVELQT